MKKLICLVAGALLAGCTLLHTVQYPAPAAPDGYTLIDVYDAGRPKDYVKFHNYGENVSLDAVVMFHNPATMEWETYGGVSLKGAGDTDTMMHSARHGGRLYKLRYFAVKFLDGKSHELSIKVANNDLHVYVK